ncbi:MAG: helix-turn-helix transcriptional regulator [Vulcanimicrobiaceae bacterium]
MIRLKLWRLQQHLTQAEAARALGIGESSYAILESGRLRPTAGQRERLRAYFGELTDSLFDPVSERVEAVR